MTPSLPESEHTPGKGEPTWSEDWRCPDCGMGITMVHVHAADGLLRGCGKPPDYWTRPRGEQSR